MATIISSQLFETSQKVLGFIDKIMDSTNSLQGFIDREKENLLNPEVCDQAYRGLDDFRRFVYSVQSASRQLIDTVNNPVVNSHEIEKNCCIIDEELDRACGIYTQLCSMLKEDAIFGKSARIDDLNAMLTSQTILLDELRAVLVEFECKARDIAIQSQNNISFSESYMDIPNGFDVEFDGDVCPAPDGGWIDEESYQSSCGGWGMEDASMSECPLPTPEMHLLPGAMPLPPSAPSVSSSKSEAKKVKPVKVDSVAFSVLSPERVKAGEYSTVDVYMYTKSQRKIIERAIKAAESAVKETGKSGFSVSRGTEVSVILTSDDVKITDEVDTRTWDGECCRFDFQFLVPEDYSKKQIAFTCQVLFGGIQITRLHFTVSLSGTAARVPVKVKRKDCRKAFVSYSHKDEKRVLNQLSAIVEVAPRMVFWLDSQSMENGDIWRQEIRRAIRNADVFLLFWSIYSSKSDEVEKEWRYARKKKGIRFILPVPLDPISQCPPPEELGKELHFSHRTLSYTNEMDGLTFASSKQFRKIK